MVQMTPQDQAIVKALPGNTECCDCGMKSPQWASVSFGNVFCLECSGVHRSLGVHISFVRSIAMDSWTDKQLALMKSGGNKKCNDHLKSKGIDPRTPIKAKYESDAAQLYKEVLKARVEGRPEPTSLPTKSASAPSSMNRPMSAVGGGSGGGGDPSGMERLAGESEQQYIARQTRLRDEARARMAAKFGNSGMRGAGSGGMQGIGSNPNYNPNGGYGVELDNVVSGVTSAFSTGMSLVGNVASAAASTVNSVVQEDSSARAGLSQAKGGASGYGGSFWSNLSSGISSVADSITAPDGDEGLADLQRQFSSSRPTQSKYSGFGSDSNGFKQFGSDKPTPAAMPNQFGSNKPTPAAMPAGGTTASSLAEAPGLPGEDPNGIERLTGESDEQYVARQTRLRDEAKARMAAKFGGGGLSSASSSSRDTYAPAPLGAGNVGGVAKAPASAPVLAPVPAPPRSGGLTPPRKASADALNSDDFFASFGA